ncbi:MAG TPA: dTDP-glucose 4,6-dehydratase [bacterium]
MRTIIVTGGAGFIGSNFVYYLLSKAPADRLVVFDKLTYAGNKFSLRDALRNPSVKFVKGDIAQNGDVKRLYDRYQPTLVFNFAAESHVDRSIAGAGDFVRTNLLGTFQMLEGARHYLNGLKKGQGKNFRFLHISTDEVYGSLGPRGFFKETTAYEPNSPYAATKAGADHLARAYHETYGFPVLLTNCSNNYGPYQFPEKLIPLMILNAVEGKPLPVYGDGKNVRDWLYVEDHCSALWKVMTTGRIGEKYNVGGDSERTNIEVVTVLCRLLEKILPATRNQALIKKGISGYDKLITWVKDRPGHDRRYAIDASKILKELGWRPRHDFDSGMEKTVRWYLSHLDWCEKAQAGKYGRQRLGLLKGKK